MQLTPKGTVGVESVTTIDFSNIDSVVARILQSREDMNVVLCAAVSEARLRNMPTSHFLKDVLEAIDKLPVDRRVFKWWLAQFKLCACDPRWHIKMHMLDPVVRT